MFICGACKTCEIAKLRPPSLLLDLDIRGCDHELRKEETVGGDMVKLQCNVGVRCLVRICGCL